MPEFWIPSLRRSIVGDDKIKSRLPREGRPGPGSPAQREQRRAIKAKVDKTVHKRRSR